MPSEIASPSSLHMQQLYEWKQYSAGVWRKSASVLERNFHEVCSSTGASLGREILCISPVVDLAFPSSLPEHDVISILREAWAALRYHYPDVAVDQDKGQLQYKVIETQEQLQAWLDQTFMVHNDITAGAEDYFTDCGIPALATLHYFPCTRQLLFRCSHWRTDTRGALMVINNLLNLARKDVASPRYLSISTWDDQVSKLTQSYEHCVSESPPYPPAVEEYTDQLFSDAISCFPTAGLPVKSSSIKALPGRTISAHGIKLSQKSSKDFFQACKSRGYTVTEAVETAIALANYKLNSDSTNDDLNCIIYRARDTRRYVPEQFRGPAYSPHSCSIMEMIPTPARPNYTYLADYLVKRGRQNFEPSIFVRSMNKMSQKYREMFLGPKPQDYTPSSESYTSSLGILDNYLRHDFHDDMLAEKLFTIKNVHIRAEVLGPQCCTFIYTWDEQLHIIPCFNEVYYDLELIKNLSSFIVNTLEEEFSVKLSAKLSTESPPERI